MKLKPIEKYESDFRDVEYDCNEFRYDEFDEIVCEVMENMGGDCYPWECPLCNFVGNTVGDNYDPFGNLEGIELVEVINKITEI